MTATLRTHLCRLDRHYVGMHLLLIVNYTPLMPGITLCLADEAGIQICTTDVQLPASSAPALFLCCVAAHLAGARVLQMDTQEQWRV